MKRKILAGILSLVMLMTLFGCNTKKEMNEFAQRSLDLSKLIYKDYFIDLGEGDVYIKYFKPSKPGEPDKAYLWPYMEVAAMLARLMTIVEPSTPIASNKTVKQFYEDVISGFRYYKSSRTDYTAYTASRASLPGFGSGDTYYDDNLWVAREYLNAYELLGKESYLQEAEKVTEFVLSGWDDAHDGIRWFDGPEGVGHRDYGETRNTCSNAPAIILLCRLYDETENAEYLTWAKRVYDFTKTALMDTDGTYFDNVKWNAQTGKDMLERTKWTYNSGSMISAGIYLYEREEDAGKKAQYLADAQKTALASHNLFAVNMGFKVRNYPEQPWFNLLLLDGYLELFRIDAQNTKPYIDAYYDTLDYSYTKKRDSEGYVPADWVKGWGTGTQYKSVLDMAANAENYGLTAYAMDNLNYTR